MAYLELKNHFIGGPFLEIDSAHEPMLVKFISGEVIVHAGQIEAGHWIRASRRWFCDWTIQVFDQMGKKVYQHRLDFDNQNIRIYLDSRSLGDTLAWIPQVERFAEAHPTASIYVSYHWPGLIDEAAYPNLVFIPPDADLNPCYASYSIGYYFDDIQNHHPFDPRTRSLQEVASDILGLSAQERRPKLIDFRRDTIYQKPSVTIATTSTAACKHWLFENGWQEVVDWLGSQGYEVVVVQKEPTNLVNVIDESGDHPIADRMHQIAASDFFIGLASGLSWLAWALEKPVIMISGFSLPKTEFVADCERVINYDVCHGCWNDTQHRFNRDEWNWCPRQAATTREHECSREITTEMVLQGVKRTMKKLSHLRE